MRAFLALICSLALANPERLVRQSENILRWMTKGEKEMEWFSRGRVTWLKVTPEALVLFIWTVVLPALLIGAVSAVHRLISLVRKRRGRVFISFEHEREPIADVLADEMTKCGIRAEKLPFMERPDHDTLVHQVTQQILDCDVFVCVPGKFPSFIQSEVLGASTAKKPTLFIFVEADAQHLPNTAMKGCPVFALEELKREGFRTLANFCSYLAADSRSTARLYGAVFEHLSHWGPLPFAVFFVLIGMLCYVQHKGFSLLGSPRTLVSDPANLWFFAPTLILLLVPYSVFFIRRLYLRAQLRRVIAGKNFSRDTFIPETLAHGLTGADLRKILYHGDIVAYHEAGSPDAKSP
jgi:hypothetical protein